MAGLAAMGSGAPVDIATGKPFTTQGPDERAAQASAKMAESIRQSMTLRAELATSPVLEILLEQFHERLTHLANRDRICQTILVTLVKMRHTLDTVPEHAQRRFREILGPGITLPPFVGPEAAPDEGIPAKE